MRFPWRPNESAPYPWFMHESCLNQEFVLDRESCLASVENLRKARQDAADDVLRGVMDGMLRHLETRLAASASAGSGAASQGSSGAGAGSSGAGASSSGAGAAASHP